MPRILRNYIISFAVIGMILLIVNWIDVYLSGEGSIPHSENLTEEVSQKSLTKLRTAININ